MSVSSPLYGIYGHSGSAVADKIRKTGCNALWFHGFDEKAFETCEESGLVPCVEFRTFRADFDQRPELIPIGTDGKPIRYGRLVQGVCLSRTEFVAERERELSEGMKRYRPHGVWLDYLTYAGWFETPEPDLQDSCFCKSCIAEFCDSTGIDADTPKKIRESYKEEWSRHKCERLRHHGFRFSEIVKDAAPECIIGAYMCPWAPAEYDRALGRIFGQDYALFSSFVDVFTPLIYAKKSGRENNWARSFMESSAGFVPLDKKVQPILDVLDFPGSLQSLAESSNTGWGYQIFGGASILDSEEHGKELTRLTKILQEASGTGGADICRRSQA